jgi:hypothetical protein
LHVTQSTRILNYNTNYSAISIAPSGNFEAVFFAPASLRLGYKILRPFIALDGIYTRSKFRMMLLIACSIDANDNTLLLAWALVPIENEVWWTWFCTELKKAFPNTERIGYMFISDREKGLAAVLDNVFPFVYPAYCCQYIADNIQTDYGIQARALFWPCAQAKTRLEYQKALQELLKVSLAAGEYIDNILYKIWAL